MQGLEQTKFPVTQQKMVYENGLASPSVEQSASTNDDIDEDGNNMGGQGGGGRVCVRYSVGEKANPKW